MTATMGSMKRPVPAPPRHLLIAMGDAAANNDHVAAAMLNAEYRAWLHDHGYTDTNRWENQ